MENQNKNNKKILVIEEIDDETSLRNILRDKFTHEGFKVIEAKDGEEGLALAISMHPDLILLDILMPKMDGLMVMEKVRQLGEWGESVPIIVLTNLSADDERINKVITANEPSYYLVKSDHTINNLVEKIKERLSGSF